MRALRLKFPLVVYFAGVIALYVFVCWKVRRLIIAGFPDFAIYYCAGSAVRQGLGHQLYDPGARFAVQQQFAGAVPQFRGPLPWTHPPFEALFFAPFSVFSYVHAYLLWNLFSLVLLAAALLLLRPYLPELRNRAGKLWILACLAFFPVFFNLLEGQDAMVLLFVYTLAFVALRNGHDGWAGAALALGLFKFHLVLPFVLLLLLQKRWRMLYGFVPVSALLVLVSVGLAGTRALTAYPRYVLYWEDLMAGKDRVPAGMPNLRGLWYVLGTSHISMPPLLALLSLALLWFVTWRCYSSRPGSRFELCFSLALLATVLVSYHVVSYDLVVLLIPVLVITNEMLKQKSWRLSTVLIALGMALLFLAPLELMLSLEYKAFALMGLALLLWSYGIAREMSPGSA